MIEKKLTRQLRRHYLREAKKDCGYQMRQKSTGWVRLLAAMISVVIMIPSLIRAAGK